MDDLLRSNPNMSDAEAASTGTNHLDRSERRRKLGEPLHGLHDEDPPWGDDDGVRS